VTDYAIALKNGKTRYLQHLSPPRDDPTNLFRLNACAISLLSEFTKPIFNKHAARS